MTDLDVVVLGGGGHVGLPLSLVFARAGLRVGIYDTNERTLERIGRAEMPFLENGADGLLAEVLPTDRLTLSADAAIVGRSGTVVVVIGTPVDEFLNPSMTVFERTVDQIAPHLQDGALVVLRSTVYPGTTEYVAGHLAARGCRVDVVFCPERIAEGHALEEIESLPQIVGADTDAAAARAEALFGRLAGPPRVVGGRGGLAGHPRPTRRDHRPSAKEQEGLLGVLRSDPGWRLVNEDRDGAVFVRSGR